jgi:hypothetical protein
MRTASSSGMNYGQSPCWPGGEDPAAGRHRRSAARWILVLSPPRERPSASRPGRAAGFLSFDGAPRGQLRGQRVAGPGGVLVRPHHGGIGADRPVLPLGFIAPSPQPAQDSPTSRPATSGDAGYRRSSSSRTHQASHATGSPSGSGRRSRRSPSGDYSTAGLAGHRQASSAAAAAIPYLLGHDDSGDHPLALIYTRQN